MTFVTAQSIARRFFSALILVVLVAGPGGEVFSATDQFTISQGVTSTDAGAPTVPQNLTATPVGATEIDLSWDASTDDMGVTGYQVFRNGSQIATSAVPSYADTGLTPSTSYDYTVTAYDAANYISTTSATTTAATNAVSTSEPGSGGNAPKPVKPLLSDLAIAVTEYSAKLSWKTSIPTRSIVSWGRTSDYEIASLGESTHLSSHATLIPNLLPGIEYKFKIVGRDKSGTETILREGSFVTTPLADTEAPPNVSELRGWIENTDALLSWKNPKVFDFAKVRIVRKEGGYPRDPFDGTLIYEGGNESYRDESVFSADGVRFYGIFAYDEKGNESSGAVVRLQKKNDVLVPAPSDEPVSVVVDPDSDTATYWNPLRFEDLIFEQDGEVVSFRGEGIRLDATRPFTIKLLYDRLPEHLKTILVTFSHPSDISLTFSFILRVNNDKTAYAAVIDSLGDPGQYGLSLSVLDYHERTVSKVNGHFIAERRSISTEVEVTDIGFLGFLLSKLSPLNPWVIVTLLMLLLLVIYFATKKKKEPYMSHDPAVTYVPLKH